MKLSPINQIQKDLEDYNRLTNEEQFPALIEAIQALRLVLNKLRQHHFIGVPAFRRLRINPHINLSGRWLQERGFEKDKGYYLINLNGLLILCPAKYPKHREANAAMETELTFGPSNYNYDRGWPANSGQP